MKNFIVKKFGGTSVASTEKIKIIAKRIAEDIKRGERPLIVLSAMSGYTDSLIQMADRVFPDYQGEAYDMLLSSGEQVSISLLSMALKKRNIPNKPLLAHQAGIQTSSFFSKACIESIRTEKIKSLFKKNIFPLIAGFQGVTKQNEITTLGRGGSDLTAVALSSALKIKTCEIYTDVRGVFTADPQLVPKARKQKHLSFSEMMEMSYLGSKVLQIRSVEMASKHGINLHVRHAFKKEEGTWITKKKENFMEGSLVSAVAHDLNTLVIKFNKTAEGVGFISELFTKLGKESVFVDIISQSGIGVPARLAFSIPKTDLKKSLSVLKKLKLDKNISIIDGVAKISIIGVGMASYSGVAGRFFSVIKKTKARLYLVTTSEIKISAIIDKTSLKKTARALHKEFDL